MLVFDNRCIILLLMGEINIGTNSLYAVHTVTLCLLCVVFCVHSHWQHQVVSDMDQHLLSLAPPCPARGPWATAWLTGPVAMLLYMTCFPSITSSVTAQCFPSRQVNCSQSCLLSKSLKSEIPTFSNLCFAFSSHQAEWFQPPW